MFKQLFQKKSELLALERTYIVILIFSFLGSLAAFTLSVETFHLLKEPGAVLSCSINSVLNCASVMKTPQAELFGFPNSFLGMIGYPIFFFFALTALLGVKYTKNIVSLLFGGAVAAFLFALWLFFDSVYVIQILCPWCLLTTFSTILVCAGFTRLFLQQNGLRLSKKSHQSVKTLLDNQYDVVVTATLVVILLLLVVMKFGNALWS